MENRELCPLYCGGNLIKIGKPLLKQENLKIWENEERVLYFSVIGNKPKTPRIAIVGLSPGQNQLRKLIKGYNDGLSFQEAAEIAGFSLREKELARAMRAMGIDRELGIQIDDNYNFNESPYFYITSLVKCAFMGKDKKPSKAFPPLKYEVSRKCIKHRFMKEIFSIKEIGLKRVFILGDKGWEAVNSKDLFDNGISIKEILEREGLKVEKLPHTSRLRFPSHMKKFKEDILKKAQGAKFSK